MNKKSRRSRAIDISQTVKQIVWKRDHGRCVICKSLNAFPNAHCIPRSEGGLGIPENIVTLCMECHRQYDQSTERSLFAKRIESYLKRKYPHWSKSNLYYNKEKI